MARADAPPLVLVGVRRPQGGVPTLRTSDEPPPWSGRPGGARGRVSGGRDGSAGGNLTGLTDSAEISMGSPVGPLMPGTEDRGVRWSDKLGMMNTREEASWPRPS